MTMICILRQPSWRVQQSIVLGRNHFSNYWAVRERGTIFWSNIHRHVAPPGFNRFVPAKAQYCLFCVYFPMLETGSRRSCITRDRFPRLWTGSCAMKSRRLFLRNRNTWRHFTPKTLRYFNGEVFRPLRKFGRKMEEKEIEQGRRRKSLKL